MARARPRGSSIAPIVIAAGSFALLGSAEFARRVFRRSRLFVPSAVPLRDWNPVSYGFTATDVDRLEIRSGPLTLDGWYCRAVNPVGSVLYCHGNSGNITWFAEAIRELTGASLNVLLFDYRGFGRSGGKPTIAGSIRDARAAADVLAEIGDPDLPMILWGYSLGGAIAAQIVRERSWDALVLQSTFSSLTEIARAHFAGTLIPHIVGRILDTREVLVGLEIPVAILHGREDRTVPFEMAEVLRDRCVTSRLTPIEGGKHIDLHLVDPLAIRRAIRGLLRDVTQRKPPASSEPDGSRSRVRRWLSGLSTIRHV